METKLLSILIPTIPGRESQLKKLINSLSKQIVNRFGAIKFTSDEMMTPELHYFIYGFGDCGIEIVTAWDDSKMSIGNKRNELLKKAQGEYIVFFDDDDLCCPAPPLTPYPRYISAIMKALESKPDVVGFNGYVTYDGIKKEYFSISKDYGGWYTEHNFHYRTPNHLSPVRREIALKAGFPDKKFAEDYEYSMRILPYLKTEVKIIEDLYHYAFKNK